MGTNITVAYHALPVALFAQATDRDAGLLHAHDQVRLVLRHLARSVCPSVNPSLHTWRGSVYRASLVSTTSRTEAGHTGARRKQVSLESPEASTGVADRLKKSLQART